MGLLQVGSTVLRYHALFSSHGLRAADVHSQAMLTYADHAPRECNCANTFPATSAVLSLRLTYGCTVVRHAISGYNTDNASNEM